MLDAGVRSPGPSDTLVRVAAESVRLNDDKDCVMADVENIHK